MHEGQRVIYVGGPTDYVDLQPGCQGRLLVHASATHAHFQGSTGNVYLVEHEDLAPERRTASVDPLADSLEVGSISIFAVREIYDTEGESGVIQAMASSGHLASFSEIAEDALSMVASRIRQDPSFREVLAHLDEEEGESVLRMAAACLLRDAYGEIGDEAE